MNYRELAGRLLGLLNVHPTEENTNGVIGVFSAFKQGVDNEWLELIANNTNETLAYYHETCKCGRIVQVSRTKTIVNVNVM